MVLSIIKNKMPHILPNGKILCRQKGQKDKISIKKTSTIHKRLLAVVCGLQETSVQLLFSQKRLELSNPYAVKKFLEERLERYGELCKQN